MRLSVMLGAPNVASNNSAICIFTLFKHKKLKLGAGMSLDLDNGSDVLSRSQNKGQALIFG